MKRIQVPTHITMHHSLTKDSGTVSWGAIRRYHTIDRGWAEIGYQFGIEDIAGQSEILVGRMMNEQGAHCPQSNMNRRSIGICLVGNFDDYAPPHPLWDAAVRFVSSLCSVLSIPVENVRGHRDYNSHKSCPGRLFDLEKFRKEVKSGI